MASELKKLNIETSSQCNLNCRMCVRAAWEDGAGPMALETYRRLLPAFPQLSFVALSGYGEPLLNRHIIDMIRVAKSHLPTSAQVGFTTNGVGIDKDMARDLVASGLDALIVSIDGISPQTFSGIRLGADLDRVLANIEQLNRAKKRLGSPTPRLGFEFVAMKANVKELPQVIQLAGEYKASLVIVSHLLPHVEGLKEQVVYDANSDLSVELFELARAEAKGNGANTLIYPDFIPYIYALFGIPPLRGHQPEVAVARSDALSWTKGLPPEPERSLQVLERAISRAVERGVVLNFSKLQPQLDWGLAYVEQVFAQARAEAERLHIQLDLPPLQPRAKRECGFIKSGTAFISWDGYVRSCNNLSHTYPCYINGRRKKITGVSFGNVMEQELLDIWNSPKYVDFRRRVEKFDFPPCGDCNFNEGCNFVIRENFEQDCYFNPQPCGDCLWSRGILQCL